ncbi:MAG: hypothetical protein ACFFER_05575 [Candidatus Thorarchaeota archaeon]
MLLPLFPPGIIVRDIILLLDGAIVFYSFLLGIVLLGQWYRSPFRRAVDVKLAWGLFFIGMVGNTSAFMLADFYYTDDPLNIFWVKIGYMCLILALVAFFSTIERMLPYRLHHAFSITGLVSAGLTIVSPRDYIEAVALFISIVTFIGVMIFLTFSIRNTSGAVRRSIGQIVAGFLIGFVGFLGRSDVSYYALGELIYAFGAALMVVGLIIFGYALIMSPALDELDWRQQLIELYIIQEGGLLIFHHHFEEVQDIDQVLTAAGISGVQSLFQEITRSEEGLNVVSIGDYEILFAHGGSFSSVLISRKAYLILLSKVQEFTDKFDLIFGPIIERFEGSLREFSSVHELVASVF